MAKVDQRDALEVLTRVRLIALAQAFGLDVNKRGNKDEIIDVLARSRRAGYEAILGVLSRKELEEICRAYGLSDKRKDKAGLIDRILGRSGKVIPLARVAEPKKPGQGNKKKATKAAASEQGKKARGPLQPVVDELKRNYCLEVLGESSSMSAAARVAGFTPRGFQLMLRKLGIEAERAVGRKTTPGALQSLADELERHCRGLLEESSSLPAAAKAAGFTSRGFRHLLEGLGMKAGRAANEKEARGPLQPLVDDLKRDYCRELLEASPSMTAAAGAAGFTPRGFQLLLMRLGMKAEDHLGGG